MSTNEVSPANSHTRSSDRKRVPMSTPQQKLAVDSIPGHHLYWMKGTPERLSHAIRGGYEFVETNEVHLHNGLLGDTATISGNSDMGSRVSVIAGDEVGADGQPIRLYLMKIKEEWHQEDLKIQESQNDGLRKALQSGRIGSDHEGNSSDINSRYVGSQTSHNMFQPKPLRRS